MRMLRCEYCLIAPTDALYRLLVDGCFRTFYQGAVPQRQGFTPLKRVRGGCHNGGNDAIANLQLLICLMLDPTFGMDYFDCDEEDFNILGFQSSRGNGRQA